MTLEFAEAKLAAAEAAVSKAMEAQSYTTGGRGLQRALLSTLIAERNRWQHTVDSINAGGTGGITGIRIVPRSL